MTKHKKSIFSDSVSVLMSLSRKKTPEKPTEKLLNKLHAILKTKAIIFCWVLSHIGIKAGNGTNLAAKSTAGMVVDHNLRIPYTDIKVMVSKNMKGKWPELWKNNPQNKLFKIKLTWENRH